MKTVIVSILPTVKSLEGICPRSCVELTKVVCLSEPLNRTTEFDTKFVPFTVSENATVSGIVLLVGKMLEVVGIGLVTVKV